MFRRRRTDLLLHVIAAEMVRGQLHSCRLGQDVREVQECAYLGVHIDNRPSCKTSAEAGYEKDPSRLCFQGKHHSGFLQ